MKATTHTKIFHGCNISFGAVLIWLHAETVQLGRDMAGMKATVAAIGKAVGVPYAEAPRIAHTNFFGEVRL